MHHVPWCHVLTVHSRCRDAESTIKQETQTAADTEAEIAQLLKPGVISEWNFDLFRLRELVGEKILSRITEVLTYKNTEMRTQRSTRMHIHAQKCIQKDKNTYMHTKTCLETL